MQKIITLLAAICCTIGSYAYVKVNGVYYELNTTDRTAEVINAQESDTYKGAISIRSSITSNGTSYTVTSIAQYAFMGCAQLKSVSLPATLTKIGAMAFVSCLSLDSIVLPASLTEIGAGAFMATKMKKIKVNYGSGLPAFFVWDDALYDANNGMLIVYANGNGATEFAVMNGCPHIGPGAFYDNQTLTRLVLPATVDTIDNVAIGYNNSSPLQTLVCRSATPPYCTSGAIRFPSGCEIIVPAGSLAAYQAADQWRNYTATEHCLKKGTVDGLNYQFDVIKKKAKVLAADELSGYSGDIHIPVTADFWGESYNVTAIDNGAFTLCTRLTSVNFPSGIDSIGISAFYGCVMLENLVFPKNLSYIGQGAFFSCYSVKNIRVSDENEYFRTVNGVLFTKDKTTLLQYPVGLATTEYIVPEGVETIGYGAFSMDTTLHRVELPSTLTLLEDYAFFHCDRLDTVVCEAMTPPVCRNTAFFDVHRDQCTLEVHTLSTGLYGAAPVWKTFSPINGVITGLQEQTIAPADGSKKMIKDGQIYILRGGKAYDLTGREIL